MKKVLAVLLCLLMVLFTSSVSYAQTPDWTAAFGAVLDQEQAQAAAEAERIGCAVSCEYALYDIDKDATPELIVKIGSCEADYRGHLYRFSDGQAKPLGEIGLSHSSFYTDPEHNAVILMQGHMGYAWAEWISVVDDELVFTELYEDNLNERLQSDPEAEYVYPDAYVPGAAYLSLCRASVRLALTRYQEISAYLSGRFPASAGTVSEEDVSFYEAVMAGVGTVCAVGADEFSHSPGQISFQELLRKDVAADWMEQDAQVVSVQYGDLNGDGRLECLAALSKDSYGGLLNCVLSRQGETVYAYLINYLDDLNIDGNGCLVHRSLGGYGPFRYRLIFEGEQALLLQVGSPTQDRLNTLLDELRDGVQPGTAGASLKTAGVAADLLDWAAGGPDRTQLAEKVGAWLGAQSEQTRQMLPEQIATLRAGAQQLLDDYDGCAGLLEDAGLSGRGPWTAEAGETLNGLLSLLGA